jgi:hypothetical protein
MASSISGTASAQNSGSWNRRRMRCEKGEVMKTKKMKAEARKNLLHILRHGKKNMRDLVKSELKILLAYTRLKAAVTGNCDHANVLELIELDESYGYRWCADCGGVQIKHARVQKGWMLPDFRGKEDLSKK